MISSLPQIPRLVGRASSGKERARDYATTGLKYKRSLLLPQHRKQGHCHFLVTESSRAVHTPLVESASFRRSTGFRQLRRRRKLWRLMSRLIIGCPTRCPSTRSSVSTPTLCPFARQLHLTPQLRPHTTPIQVEIQLLRLPIDSRHPRPARRRATSCDLPAPGSAKPIPPSTASLRGPVLAPPVRNASTTRSRGGESRRASLQVRPRGTGYPAYNELESVHRMVIQGLSLRNRRHRSRVRLPKRQAGS